MIQVKTFVIEKIRYDYDSGYAIAMTGIRLDQEKRFLIAQCETFSLIYFKVFLEKKFAMTMVPMDFCL